MMAVDVTVKRGAGDRPASEISSGLMVSSRVAGARGAFEVDHDSTDRLQVAADLVDTRYKRRRQIIEVAEEEETWRGMVTGFERTIELTGDADNLDYSVVVVLEIEREDRR